MDCRFYNKKNLVFVNCIPWLMLFVKLHFELFLSTRGPSVHRGLLLMLPYWELCIAGEDEYRWCWWCVRGAFRRRLWLRMLYHLLLILLWNAVIWSFYGQTFYHICKILFPVLWFWYQHKLGREISDETGIFEDQHLAVWLVKQYLFYSLS